MKQLYYQCCYILPIWLVMLLTCWLPDNKITLRIRGFGVALFLPGRPKSFKCGRDVTLLAPNRLNVGRNVYFAKGTWINAHGGIFIGDDVMTGPYVVMSSTNHIFENGRLHKGKVELTKISVNNSCWIGAHSIVTAGSELGEFTVVGANSVITKSHEGSEVIAGTPAKQIKKR